MQGPRPDVPIVPYYRPPLPSYTVGHNVKRSAESRIISNGPLCRDFEESIRDLQGARYALSCSSCTMGLILALRALRALTKSKDVYLPAFTWYSTGLAVEASEMNRVFVDSDPGTWTMVPSGHKDEITMPVSTFGAYINPGDYTGSILVDGAHALTVHIDLAHIAGVLLSFSPSKLLTCGEGGMLLTEFSEVAAKFEELRNKFGRMSEANAAMGLAHMDGLDAYMRDRKRRWEAYAQLFKSPQKATLTNYSIFGARVKNRQTLQDHLKASGIESRAYYTPLVEGLKNSDVLGKEVVCLPNWYGCPTDVVITALKAYSKDPI